MSFLLLLFVFFFFFFFYHIKINCFLIPFSCPVCPNKISLQMKQNADGTGNGNSAAQRKLFECDVCNMKFSNGANMRRHKMRHTGKNAILPFGCVDFECFEILRINTIHASVSLNLLKVSSRMSAEYAKNVFSEKIT